LGYYVAKNESLEERAEAMAILGASDFLNSAAPKGSKICIFVDSLSLLMAPACQGKASALVGNVYSALREEEFQSVDTGIDSSA